MRRPTLPPAQFWTAVALLCLGAVTLASVFGPCTQDDAFISLRYAQNLVEGHGLVYNAGERVEGYTNLAWTLLLAIPLWLDLDPVRSSAVLGVVHWVAAVVAGGWVGRRALGDSRWALIPPLLVVMDPFAALEAVEGLETCMYMAVLAAGLARFLGEVERPSLAASHHVPSALIFSSAALIRPEAPLLPALLHVGLLLHGWAGARDRVTAQLRQAVLAGLPVATTLAGLTAWRLAYYGDPLPNTFYAKTGAAGFTEGGQYLVVHALDHPGLWLLFLAGLALGLRSRAGLAIGIATTGFLTYVASVGGDFKPTGRFILPVVVWMATLGARGLLRCGARIQAGALAVLVVATAVRLPDVWTSAGRWADIRHANLNSRALVGTFLRENFPPDTWIAIHSAGAIPFYSALPTIDMWGLNDRHIARAPVPEHSIGLVGHQRGDPDYVFEREPALYLPEDKVFTLRAWQLEAEPGFPADFTERYESITIPLEGRFLNIWARKGFFRELDARRNASRE